MEKVTVIALLEKYFQAETTVDEEKALSEYFRRQSEPDPDLEPYREMFGYFGKEAEVSAGPGFEERILQRVGLNARPAGALRPARTFRLGILAAAASICAIVVGISLLTPSARQTPPAIASRAIHDTYDNPEQALAAVRHALLIASEHLNEGTRSFDGQKK